MRQDWRQEFKIQANDAMSNGVGDSVSRKMLCTDKVVLKNPDITNVYNYRLAWLSDLLREVAGGYYWGVTTDQFAES